MNLRIKQWSQSPVLFLLLTCFLFFPLAGKLFPCIGKAAAAGNNGVTLRAGETAPEPVLARPNFSHAVGERASSGFMRINLRLGIPGESPGKKETETTPEVFLRFGSAELFLQQNQPLLLAGWVERQEIKEGKTDYIEDLSWLQTAPPERSGEKQEGENVREREENRQVLRPAFTNIKEKVGIYAFVAWMWLVIAVFLYVLNEQVKEADRCHRYKL